MALKDATGRDLYVGDEIVYPYLWSAHTLGMRSARIVEIRDSCIRVEYTDRILKQYGRWGKAKGAFVYKIENVVKV